MTNLGLDVGFHVKHDDDEYFTKEKNFQPQKVLLRDYTQPNIFVCTVVLMWVNLNLLMMMMTIYLIRYYTKTQINNL